VKTEPGTTVLPQLYDIQAVSDMRDNGVNGRGHRLTIYLGSEYESTMMTEGRASSSPTPRQRAHRGAVDDPRGKAVGQRKDGAFISGAGRRRVLPRADFVKVNPPKGDEAGLLPADKLVEPQGQRAHGSRVRRRSPSMPPTFLSQLYDQIHTGGAVGNATGRKPATSARATKPSGSPRRSAAITLGDYRVDRAVAVFNGEEDFTL